MIVIVCNFKSSALLQRESRRAKPWLIDYLEQFQGLLGEITAFTEGQDGMVQGIGLSLLFRSCVGIALTIVLVVIVMFRIEDAECLPVKGRCG